MLQSKLEVERLATQAAREEVEHKAAEFAAVVAHDNERQSAFDTQTKLLAEKTAECNALIEKLDNMRGSQLAISNATASGRPSDLLAAHLLPLDSKEADLKQVQHDAEVRPQHVALFCLNCH